MTMSASVEYEDGDTTEAVITTNCSSDGTDPAKVAAAIAGTLRSL